MNGTALGIEELPHWRLCVPATRWDFFLRMRGAFKIIFSSENNCRIGHGRIIVKDKSMEKPQRDNCC